MKIFIYGFMFALFSFYTASSVYLYCFGNEYQILHSYDFKGIDKTLGHPTAVDLIHGSIYFENLPNYQGLGIKILYTDNDTIYIRSDRIEELNKLGNPIAIQKIIGFGKTLYICPIDKESSSIAEIAQILSYRFRCRTVSQPIS